MLYEEFEELVGFRIKPEAFDHFNELYMELDIDKEQFCKLAKPLAKKFMRPLPSKPIIKVCIDYCTKGCSLCAFYILDHVDIATGKTVIIHSGFIGMASVDIWLPNEDYKVLPGVAPMRNVSTESIYSMGIAIQNIRDEKEKGGAE